MKNLSIISTVVIVTLLSSCKDNDPTPENPEELITTLNMVFTPHGGGPSMSFQFRDVDGDGGNPPVIIGGTLAAQTEYHATLSLLDETSNPPEDITEEILDEDEAHQFFFEFIGVPVVVHTYDDMDSNGNPIGIVNNFLTSNAGVGTLTVTLRHNPDKDAAGVDEGGITLAGGETDIQVMFPVTIQ